jgi:diguanylate cyclase (GGDEF)-like protein
VEILTESTLLERCRQWHDHHLKVYFTERDLAKSLATYHPQAIGVGTGRGEFGHIPEAMREVVRRDLQGFPGSIDYAIRQRAFHCITDQVIACQALLDLSLEIDTHRMNLRDLRHTMVVCLDDELVPRICHIHVSFPTDVHGDEEPYPLKEIEEISSLVDELIANKTQDLMAAYRKLERMAIVDRLTGLYNRIRLDEKLQQEIIRANRYGSNIALCMLDIDDFKTINDSHGHLAGDQVLKTLGEILRDTMRDTDLAGRWGGEEFMLILPETSAEQAQAMAERIRETFEGCRFQVPDSEPVGMTVSCGIAAFETGDDVDSLFQRADRALYKAKHNGKNCTMISPG